MEDTDSPKKEEQDDATDADYFEPLEGLSAESVIAFAQSVGVVTLPEDVAESLSEFAMRQLRAATMLALQFADHENAAGLRVSDFSKAENLLNYQSFGHRSSLPAPATKPIDAAKVSILDEGPEIDLYTTISSSKISTIVVEDLDPKFHVHQTVVNGKLSVLPCDDNNTSMDETDNLCDTPIVPGTIVNDIHGSESVNVDMDKNIPNHISNSTNSNELNLNILNVNHVNDDLDETNSSSKNITPNQNNIDSSSDYTFTNGPIDDKESVSVSAEDIYNVCEDLRKDGLNCKDFPEHDSTLEYLELDCEWIEYMQLFVSCILHDSPPLENTFHNNTPSTTDEIEDAEVADEFSVILRDLVQYGVLPILDVIFDFFCDYIRGAFGEISALGLRRIISAIEAVTYSSCSPSQLQMQKMSSLLIEILVLPSTCEIQVYLCQVFMKILKKYDDLLTWTCTYITEVLKRTAEVSVENINDVHKSLLHGALCLTNGLEILKIQVAQEFGWHSSVLHFSRKHKDAIKAGLITPNETDGFVEEQLLGFCKHFLSNYRRLLNAADMKHIYNSFREIFGEKIVPYMTYNELSFSSNNRRRESQRHKADKLAVQAKSRCVVRKGFFKNKRISIPYKFPLIHDLL